MSQFEITINHVCSDCNSGWLNELEDAALPVLDFLGRDAGVVPNRVQFQDFAYWAVVRALLRTHSSSAGHAPEHLFRVAYEHRAKRTIPEGCIIQIGCTQPVSIEAGTHQSAILDGQYLGHVAVSMGNLLISVLLGEPGAPSSDLATDAAEQVNGWFPGCFWQLAPVFRPPDRRLWRALTADEALVAGSCLGFFLGISPCDQFGRQLSLDGIVPPGRRGDVPWPLPMQDSVTAGS